MRTHCPACGEPFEDDGDRRWDDFCWQCGWTTPYRRAADKYNNELFAAAREGRPPPPRPDMRGLRR